MKLNNYKNAWILAVLLGAGLAGNGVAKPETETPQGTQSTRVGNVLIDFGTWEIINSSGERTVSRLQGNAGKDVVVRSQRYDMAAPLFVIELTQNLQVDQSRATGGVTLQVREPEDKRVTDLKCREAIYRAGVPRQGNTPGKPARIDLQGNVRAVMRSPQVTESNPLVVTAETGYIEFVDATTTRIVLQNGQATGTPVEPAPKPKEDNKKPDAKP
ncbi:MAG: hypothetical protein OHK0029_40880 [Armatimonadaceae bacterium]